MASSDSLQKALQRLTPLTDALADGAATALVCADGRWHLDRDGSLRRQTPPLAEGAASQLVGAVSRQGPSRCLDGWWVHPLSSQFEETVVFERRPSADPDGFSRRSLRVFHNRISPGANGLIFGSSRHARSGLLLSLVQRLPPELIVYVGPVPPSVPAEVSLLHVDPPRDDRDRRQLATLFDRASAVLFDGPVSRADVRLLFSGETIAHRWLTVDASKPTGWASSFGVPDELIEPITTRVGVRGSPVQSVRLSYLAVRHGDDWNVLLDQDDLHGDADDFVAEKTRPAADMEITEPESKTPVELTSRQSNDERTTHPETPSETLGDADSSTESQKDEQLDETSRVEDPEQALDDAFLDDDSTPDDSTPDDPSERESGEIDVPGFSTSDASEKPGQKESSEAVFDTLEGERIDQELPGLVASSDIDDVEIPDIQPEQLRRTVDGSLNADIEKLRRERAKQRRRASDGDRSLESSPEGDDADGGLSEDSGGDGEPDTREVDVPDGDFDEFEGDPDASKPPGEIGDADSESETDELDPDRM